ncbi:MAG: type I DNA topoisomerase [Veillonellaceae bacterium]|nr:type I DNA topoisomerase [Veillonellaceae bacterium]
MAKNLVIVESPAKASTIEKYLGKSDYLVKATMGHLRDLPKSQFGIDVDNGFDPKYIIVRGKTALANELLKLAGQAKQVFLATDPDREGEAIAWHLAAILHIDATKACRIEFNEITKSAVSEAIKHARKVDEDMVNAQQTRRILDRIVGYKLSPLLWKKVRRGLSAGRVQSVAVRLICDREREIEAFQVAEYWSIHVLLQKRDSPVSFEVDLVTVDGQKVEILNEEAASAIKKDLSCNNSFRVEELKRRDRQRKPYPPFITSTLQQDASHKLGFSAKKTMMLAQQLYEEGHITYMRTDSTRIASSAQTEAREWIGNNLGAVYLPPAAPQYTKKSAQDAHEAIRPSLPQLTAEQLPATISRDQKRLYELIWKRFISSQMKPAIFDTLTVEIHADKYGFRATGSVLRFPGFMAVYADSVENGNREENDKMLPPLAEGEELTAREIRPVQHFTDPPPRFTEAALIKLLEEKGIGRPSTYAPIIDTIQGRGYVVKTEKKFQPTPLGFIVNDLLQEYFPKIVDVGFTAAMETKLDEIAQGEQEWRGLLQEFYGPFVERIAQAEAEAPRIKVPEEITDIACENCGAPMAVKHGRFGAFLGCTRFPECRTTRPLVKEIGVACPLCEKPVVERKTKTGRLFYGCSDYPACNFISWNKPTGELCPVCGAFLVEKKYKNQPAAAECSNAECPTRQGNSKPADTVKDQEKQKKITKPAKPAVKNNTDAITRRKSSSPRSTQKPSQDNTDSKSKNPPVAAAKPRRATRKRSQEK